MTIGIGAWSTRWVGNDQPQISQEGSGQRQQLPHGYTNESWRRGDRIYKRYVGPDALRRLRVEINAIRVVGRSVPTPAVIEVLETELTVVFGVVAGIHGQDLLGGQPKLILQEVGSLLRRLNDSHPFIVHGDYGPQNILFDSATLRAKVLLDWEFSHTGDPVQDLAWAEWIVRMHHLATRQHLDSLFDGYGQKPAWTVRHAAMLRRCQDLKTQSTVWGDSGAIKLWGERIARTERWID